VKGGRQQILGSILIAIFVLIFLFVRARHLILR
jgi:hypothetical protein